MDDKDKDNKGNNNNVDDERVYKKIEKQQINNRYIYMEKKKIL